MSGSHVNSSTPDGRAGLREIRRDEFQAQRRGRHRFTPAGPQTHALPNHVMWEITMCTAVSMALANFVTVWTISTIVEWKFRMMQTVINTSGVMWGILTIASIVGGLATLCACLVTFIAPGAGGSGAPENKGWLNGNVIPGLFTYRNLFGRAAATILANTAGYPVGREGPTVTMGSNLAFLITHAIALPHVQQWIHVESPSCSAALCVDEERFAHAKRITCTVGGACGMAMLFDSPIGGIVYMFEEITSASWPLELTFRAFAGTIVCSLVSRGLLAFCGTNMKAFVVYEWNPRPQPWSWKDMPYFILLGVFMGPFSAFHTRACLYVATLRQKVMSYMSRCQPYAKMADAIFYSTIVVCTYAFVALLGKCYKQPGMGIEFVRYGCKEGEYNPVASLLLTTTDASVKRLFSTRNEGEIHWPNELLGFLAYTLLNIGLTGIPVPSGNFTGSMLIGGLAGRIMGCVVRENQLGGIAVTGVYSMIGAATMLCGFKQMSVAVVIFISGCANDLNLVPPLMCSVAVSLFLNKLINERGFDEEQIMRKKIPFLLPELPSCMDGVPAKALCENLPADAILPIKAPLWVVKKALAVEAVDDFPVVKQSGFCVGFTTRERLHAALKAREEDGTSSATPLRPIVSPQKPLAGRYAKDDGEAEFSRVAAEFVGKEAGSAKDLPVDRIADCIPHMVLEDMTAPRFYSLFAQAGVRTLCVIKENGMFSGMISRMGLIDACRRAEEGHDMRIQAEDESPLEEEEAMEEELQGLGAVSVSGNSDDEACKSCDDGDGDEEEGFLKDTRVNRKDAFAPL